MFEVYYRQPTNTDYEAALTAMVSHFGGRLDYHERANGDTMGAVCLTYEFDDCSQAESAAAAFRERGEHVDGPVEYPPHDR